MIRLPDRRPSAARPNDTGGDISAHTWPKDETIRPVEDWGNFEIRGPRLKNSNVVGGLLSIFVLFVALLVSFVSSDWKFFENTLTSILKIWSVVIVFFSLLLAAHSPVARLILINSVLTSTFRFAAKFLATPLLLLIGGVVGFYLQFNAEDLGRRTSQLDYTEREIAFFSTFGMLWVWTILVVGLAWLLCGWKIASNFYMTPMATRYRACVGASKVLPQSMQKAACRRINELTTPLAVMLAWVGFAGFLASLLPSPGFS